MAGVTDTLFRRVIRGLGGCGLLMTEFTSSEGITRSAAKTLRYLYFRQTNTPSPPNCSAPIPTSWQTPRRWWRTSARRRRHQSRLPRQESSEVRRLRPPARSRSPRRNFPRGAASPSNSANDQAARRMGRKLHRRRGSRQDSPNPRRRRRRSPPSHPRQGYTAAPTGPSSPRQAGRADSRHRQR